MGAGQRRNHHPAGGRSASFGPDEPRLHPRERLAADAERPPASPQAAVPMGEPR
jgi:hypothetical protein